MTEARVRDVRAQLDLMAEVRDKASKIDTGGYFERWMDALVPLTAELIRELHDAECRSAGIPTNPWCNIHGIDWSLDD